MALQLNLQKGETMKLNLSKDSDLKKVCVAMGWLTDYDLDTIAMLYDKNGRHIKTVFYGRKDYSGVSLDGDDRHGGKSGDCETITVNSRFVPEEVDKIIFCANIYNAKPARKGIFGMKSGDDFSNVKGAFIRLYNGDSKEELAMYKLTEDGAGFNAFYFANLVREGSGWKFTAVGQGMNGSVRELESQLSSFR